MIRRDIARVSSGRHSIISKVIPNREGKQDVLKFKHLFENYDLAKKALENWDHDAEGLDELLSKFRISSNAIYPFSQNGRICFLRLAPVEEKLEKNIFGELEFIEYLNASGYPALVPIESHSGEILLTLDTRWGTYYASSFERVPGVQIEDTGYTDEIMRAYGAALGRLHSLSARFVPNIKKWTHLEALEWTENMLQENDAPPFTLEELQAVRTELAALPMETGNYGLVHYDFEPDNVFYDESTGTCSVIDFDNGMYHFYLLDIERVFASLDDEIPGERSEQAKVEFLAGYRSEYPCPEELMQHLTVMRRFGTLFAYARIFACIDERLQDEPDWLTELRGKLEIFKRELEETIRSSR